MLAALQAKIHHLIWSVALVIVALAVVGVWGYVELHRPVYRGTPSGKPSAASIANEIQAIVQADRVLAASRGPAPALSMPAVSVVREIPGLRGFSPAQIAQILAGLKPATRQVISAHLEGQTPGPIPTAPPGWSQAQVQAVYDASLAADQKAIATSKIAVTVSQQEVAPTRVGSIFTPSGSGLAFAVYRRGHYQMDLGAILRGTHISPVISPQYLIPHTQVAVGPFIGYDRRTLYGVAITVQF